MCIIQKFASSVLILIFSLSPILIYSQDQFKEGFYVDLKNDTIHGFIRDNDWMFSPNHFLFKSSMESDEKKFLPSQVHSFQFLEGDVFIAQTLPVEVTPTSVNRLVKDSSLNYEDKSIFLKTLIRGKASLYKYSEANFTRYFLFHEGEHEQLIYKQYLTENGEIATINYFRNQLFSALKCEKLRLKNFENLAYLEKPLKKIVKTYNSCFEEEQEEFKKERKVDMNLKIRPGAQFGFLEVDSPGRDTDNFGSQLAFRIGLELEYILPYNNSKWSIIFEPVFQSYSSRVDYDSFATPRFREANYTSIELGFGVRHYFFLTEVQKLFINAGGVADFPFNSSIEGNVGGNLDISRSANAFFGAGYSISNKIGFELRWHLNRDLVQPYTNHSSSFNSISLIFAYQLF